ncbi:MAG: di-trans,poly-cis-decaprenylcistransferase [Candidatus Eisenbacteria bacterium]|uniref:Isoprenyl transferase n=1 Tax=Eiseniibacteriota bacterium TaxID=2212470 RepID=A0A849SLW0_UNCEI|nr:di-trans,poly-cis-decaprenylcistransferase [Candidatus Eisenbacteria bacterium]
MTHDFALQSTRPTRLLEPPRHVAIIMDGNGRWAAARGLDRRDGHRAGAEALRKVLTAAPPLGVRTLTVYAFSADNWRRPKAEVGFLLDLFRDTLTEQFLRCVEQGIRVEFIGRRDRLPRALVAGLVTLERATARARRIRLRVALDYSSRDAILAAASGWAASGEAAERPPRDLFAHWLALADAASAREARLPMQAAPDVDLLIRTGGERRLSDFLLWECAYAELHFTDLAWPDFGADALVEAVHEYRARERRFGGLASAGEVASPAAPIAHASPRLKLEDRPWKS